MKNKYLSRKVKQLRKTKGISQEELTEESGLSLRTIQRIENGETQPTGETIKRISSALNINPEELTEWTMIEDHGFVKAMNLSALTFVVFPLLGILVPLIMWVSNKDKLKGINKAGKNLLNFEITWTIILFVGFIINSIFLGTNMESDRYELVYSIKHSLLVLIIFYIIMYAINITYIIFNTYRIQKNKELFYHPKINFIRN